MLLAGSWTTRQAQDPQQSPFIVTGNGQQRIVPAGHFDRRDASSEKSRGSRSNRDSGSDGVCCLCQDRTRSSKRGKIREEPVPRVLYHSGQTDRQVLTQRHQRQP